jgi:hypothetical protein
MLLCSISLLADGQKLRNRSAKQLDSHKELMDLYGIEHSDPGIKKTFLHCSIRGGIIALSFVSSTSSSFGGFRRNFSELRRFFV